jgi:type I restriction enzyme S subunit
MFLHQQWREQHYASVCNNHVSQASIGRSVVLLQMPIPLPPFCEQKRIVAKVEKVLGRVTAARERLAKAARLLGFELLPKATGALAQAVLAKAFRGELVPTEAELARAEGRDYEPASVLLDRVRTERASASGSPKTGRRRKT